MTETLDFGAILPAIKDAVKSEQVDIAEAMRRHAEEHNITLLKQHYSQNWF